MIQFGCIRSAYLPLFALYVGAMPVQETHIWGFFIRLPGTFESSPLFITCSSPRFYPPKLLKKCVLAECTKQAAPVCAFPTCPD